jgi:hypothetical protein
MNNTDLPLITRCLILIVYLLLFGCLGCSREDSTPQPELTRVPSGSDLARVLDVHTDKYEYDLSGLTPPPKHLVYHKIWMEMLQGDNVIQTWSTPNIICEKTGSILLAYYTPPLFTNERDTIEAKIIVSTEGESTLRISPDQPFRYSGWYSQFSRKTIEMDREYTLGMICERYSPLNKSNFGSNATDSQKTSENKALVLKVLFGFYPDKQN